MQPIDRATVEFDPRLGLIIGVLAAVMVFAVALDLRWEHFRRLARNPRPPIVGLVAQLVILPAIAYLVARALVDTPSVALGLFLVASCPGGSVSNYMTSLARGDLATSVTITAVITATCLVTTPAVFGLLASLDPATRALLREVGVDAGQVAAMFLVTIALPILAGMVLATRWPGLASKIRVWARRLALLLFAFVVVAGTAVNLRPMLDYAREAALPVTVTCAAALLVGWGLSRLAGLRAADRRAVTIEAGGQQAGLAIGMAVAFFPSLAGVAVTAVIWGGVQVLLIVPTVIAWSRMPPADDQSDRTSTR
ncbi:MAG TPA: bile acid:sodium symporter [Kofleriaceae bacterium]|nr:bile acid:sodium symporter [Kofleriaceae bacterium]